jgi:mycofactocin precursor peptide peptidase
VENRRHLGEATWRELWDRRRRPLLAVPVGSCEQHGPHLPLDTDTRVATALAEALAQAFDDGNNPGEILVAPALAIGASGEHQGFPGTLSIGNEVMESVVVELVRSADWSGGVVLVNGHGGNALAVGRAARRMNEEGRRVLAWWPQVRNGDAHAGATETALMLAIAPHLVREHLAEPGRLEPIADLMTDMRDGGVRAVSPNGVLGDPTDATASQGRALLTRLTVDLVSTVDEWWN